MSIDGAIQNVGEYFSAHYLSGDDGFSKDIKEQLKRWKDQGSQSAPRKLLALGDAFFAAKSKALDYPDPELRNKSGDKELDAWHPKLLEALGYQPESLAIELSTEKKQLPGLLRLNRFSQPWLTILQAPFCISSGDLVEDALEEFVEPTSQVIDGLPTLIVEWEKAIALLFKQEDRPRWAMLLAGSRVYLFDAHTLAQGRYIYIDLDIAYAGKDKATFDAIAALLAKDSLAPEAESDEVLHEKLREGSLKSAHGVSEQLQGAVREAIELIANGWIEARRRRGQGYKQLSKQEPALPNGSREVTAEQLKHDALVYVYRVLFCLYAEARGGELGVLPITDDIYRLGYSMEALRDLADMGEPGTQAEDGSYYAEHLNRLFNLVHEGFHPEANTATNTGDVQAAEAEQSRWGFSFPEQTDLFGGNAKQLALDNAARKKMDTGNAKTFVIQPLTATLFNPEATPLLNRIKLSNFVLHQVIRRLSLGTGRKGKQIGRINYAELGIVQLGSVYEGLLSYTGFFAKENLIQVVQAGKPKTNRGIKEIPIVFDDSVDSKKPSWFVPESRVDEFNDGEVVIEKRTQLPRIYRAGEFILHLNGVDRVNSASYYTPEVLTRTLVKEALKERLKDFSAEQSDEILALKICEPAMGSAAFLVETIDQLARQYLLLKQKQLDRTIDPLTFEEELGRVKHYIAVHNVYGVDLNPTAVELGSLSLWLASIHSLKVKVGGSGFPDLYHPGQTPWFGLRLCTGNSLIGARRAVWAYDQLATGQHYGNESAAPRQLKPGQKRKDNEIYHFLVWDGDMTPAARDKLMRTYWKEECEGINDWNKEQVKKNWTPEDLVKAREICCRIDELWEEFAEHRIVGLQQTECTATVWPIPADSKQALKRGPSLESQEHVKSNLEAQSGAFQRLKLLMDSWCSFYFWPLERSADLPSLDAWLAAAEVLLGCKAVENTHTRAMLDITLGSEIDLEILFAESQQELPDASKLAASVPWFEVARNVNASHNFHHWELSFSEILGPSIEKLRVEPKGFDLIFGNPPWRKVRWNDVPVLNEFDPLLGVRESKSAIYNQERPSLLSTEQRRKHYGTTFVSDEGVSTFLNNSTLYPSLAGLQTNLYKNFVERSWDLMSDSGIAALIHEEGIYTDSAGGYFRSLCFYRLRSHYQFVNKIPLFKDVKDNKVFSLNIFGGERKFINFRHMSNLYHPKTIDQSSAPLSTNSGIPGLRNEHGKPELRGHPLRVIWINDKTLKAIASFYEPEAKRNQCKLPSIHSQFALNIIVKVANTEQKIANLGQQIKSTEFFHESNAQRDGFITLSREPVIKPNSSSDLVMVMSHITLACPYGKQPTSGTSVQVAYEEIDLIDLPAFFVPHSIYKLNNSTDEEKKNYESKMPKWEVNGEFKVTTDYYRFAWRRRSQPDDTRTLIASIIPPGVSHVNNIVSCSVTDPATTTLLAGVSVSVVYDFLIKAFNKSDVWFDAVEKLPMLEGGVAQLIINRMLRLTCLSEDYRELWETVSQPFITTDSWSGEYTALNNSFEDAWNQLDHQNWTREVALRSDLSRRQAILEIDVLVAIALDISLDELVTIYSHYFFTFAKYDASDEFDQNGLALPNFIRQTPGRQEVREARLSWNLEDSLNVSWELQDGSHVVKRKFKPPLFQVDRIEDYKIAYRVFSKRLGRNTEDTVQKNVLAN